MKIIFSILSLLLSFNIAFADPVPPGFVVVEQGRGIKTYTKSPDWVVVADLSQGAGFWITLGSEIPYFELGHCGRWNPDFDRMPIGDHVNLAKSHSNLWWATINGSPFVDGYDQSRLAFGVKIDGQVKADGYESEARKWLQHFGSRGDISPDEAQCGGLLESDATNIAGGWPGVPQPGTDRERVAFGVADYNGDSEYEIMLMYASSGATQVHVESTLQGFGAQEIIHYDGGSSVNFQTKTGLHIGPGRQVPSALHLFESPLRYQLNVSTRGSGKVNMDPPNIDCRGNCSQDYSSGTSVNLTADADTDWKFIGWGGDCSGTNPTGCRVLMDRPRSVTANFDVYVPENFTDDPIVPGETVVKEIHIRELRGSINNLRHAYLMNDYNFRDPNLDTGDVIRAIHIQDLRSALNEVYAKVGQSPPTYTDPNLDAGTEIRHEHIQELRDILKNEW